MRRAWGPDGERLLQASEFLAASQVASFFSRQSVAVRQRCSWWDGYSGIWRGDQFKSGKGSCGSNPAPASLGVRPVRSLCHGDGRDSKEPEAFYATARVRRPGTRCTSPTHTQKGSILGASGGHYKQMHVPEVTLKNCQCFAYFLFYRIIS